MRMKDCSTRPGAVGDAWCAKGLCFGGIWCVPFSRPSNRSTDVLRIGERRALEVFSFYSVVNHAWPEATHGDENGGRKE